MTIRADHQPYVQAAVAEIEDTGLTVLGHAVTGRPPAVRTAVVTLEPPDSGPYADEEEELELVWDEAFGWMLRLPADAGTSDWFMGEDLVPAPGRVARWVDMVLSNPGLTPSREDGPQRLPESDDEAFEARLSAYAASA
ncbi:DUF6292 family protein [Streptomyces marianii]|uniref:DUF6292 domain-containing protein n=1 Tax=Streptomyces marianii TaxID=1817406 RepID=A0A5R9DTG2_9ACTN|nr:DUF6292 family protein [Streptomyces marianii]TLQ38937.1 hypothetical protein FEF34_39640 [Streptomyces marianii]